MTNVFRYRLVWLLLTALAAPQVAYAELELSGFGTLGGAVSDQDFKYQRDIDDHGTLNRDSAIGFQMDGRLTPEWGFTIQGKAAPSSHRENGWDPTLTWAFLSWRPTNDLLLRAGKLRVPLMLYSANSDVGTTFDFARLPTEVYSLTPTADVNGASFGWTWMVNEYEWTLEGYLGSAHADWRIYIRDGLPPYQPAGPIYQGVDLNLGGLVLTLHQNDNIWRVGVHRADVITDAGDAYADYPYVALAPGIGYYQVLPSVPGPGMPTVDKLINYVFTFGAEIALPHNARLIGEYARRQISNATSGADTHAAYVALLKPIGKWTPYAYLSGIRSEGKPLDLYKALNENRLPPVIPGAVAINATQRLGADQLIGYDQYSWAVGASYSFSAKSKLKAEWMQTHTGSVSSFVDAHAGEDSGGRQINVFSLSYNVTF
jgi:hypothetical protein